jgi:hypothetical protein
MIVFEGVMGENQSGVSSAAGPGDSGGPLFIVREDKHYLAGVCHSGGSVVRKSNGREVRRMRDSYIDQDSETNRARFKQ